MWSEKKTPSITAKGKHQIEKVHANYVQRWYTDDDIWRITFIDTSILIMSMKMKGWMEVERLHYTMQSVLTELYELYNIQ